MLLFGASRGCTWRITPDISGDRITPIKISVMDFDHEWKGSKTTRSLDGNDHTTETSVLGAHPTQVKNGGIDTKKMGFLPRIAMENGTFEDVFPTEHVDIPASYVIVYQRV